MQLIPPHSSFLKVWRIFYLAGLLFYGIEIPLRLVLRYEPYQFIFICDIFFNAFYITDIFLNFRTSRYQSGQLETKRSQVHRRYIKSWFFFDLFTSLPFGMIASNLGFGAMSPVLRLNHLFRVIRLFNLFESFSRLLETPMKVRLTQYLAGFILISHWTACGWIYLNPPDGQIDMATRYDLALYWTITTLTTVGYGDITPDSSSTRIYTMFIMIMGVAMYAFVIGNISRLLVKVDFVREEQRKRVNKLASYMKLYNVPIDLQKEALGFYSHLMESSSTGFASSVLNDLPEVLQEELKLHANLKMISQVPMFENISDECRQSLANSLQEVIFGSDKFVFHEEEVGNEMYFLGHGVVEVINKGQHIATINSGSFFGETALLNTVKRTASVRTMSNCILYKLKKDDFLDILEQHEDLNTKIESIIQSR